MKKNLWMEMMEQILLLQLESEKIDNIPKAFVFLTSSTPPLEMKGRVYASCVRSSMTYGSETRPLLASVVFKLEIVEI